MRDLSRKYSWLLFLFCAIFSSCLDEKVPNPPSDIPQVSLSEIKALSVANGVNANALEHCKLFEKIVFTTGTNKLSIRNLGDNPWAEELLELEIEENEKRILFFSLSEKEQQDFLDQWCIEEAKQLTEKMKFCPKLDETLAEENKVIKSVLEKDLGSGNQTLSTINAKQLQQDLKDEFIKLGESKSQTSSSSVVTNQVRSGKDAGENVDSATVRRVLSEKGSIGNILVRLAVDGHPYTFINVSNGDVGHVGIITAQVTDTFTQVSKTSVAAYPKGSGRTNGVQYETMRDWGRKSYVMEILEVKYKKNGKIASSSPVTDPSQMAKKSTSEIEKPYVTAAEFLVAKSATPHSFTCATLAWWCAKQVYHIDISTKYLPWVSPGQIYTNDHTRIKAVIQ